MAVEWTVSIVLAVVVSVAGYPTAQEHDGTNKLLQILGRGTTATHRGDPLPYASSPLSHPELTVAIAHNQPAAAHELQPTVVAEDILQGDVSDSRHKRSSEANSTDTSAEMESSATLQEPEVDSQQFFPSFSPLFNAPPLGHSRPAFYQESAYSHRPSFKPQDSFLFGTGSFRDLPYSQAVAESESNSNILGSGNYGVIRGGTYYAEERDDVLNDDIYGSYYHGNNGHGRPSYFNGNPLPAYRQGGDFFANFKDFADISAPTKSSYSEFYVVYVNPNATDHETRNGEVDSPHNSAPKNIFEQLAFLESTTSTPEKKGSKGKLKLQKIKDHQLRKENKKNTKTVVSPKDMYEPLLALS